MTDIRCEDFEREFAQLADRKTNQARWQELENHRKDCPYCRNYSTQTQNIREAISRLPKLETSPQFTFNLRREINRLEHPSKIGREIRTAPLPHTLALSTGFVMAVILGFIFLRPTSSPIQDQTTITNTASLNAQAKPPVTTPPLLVKQERSEPRVNMPTGHDQLAAAAGESGHDTLKHRLPEQPGKDSIPIPVKDDFWRMNQQVSATPGGP